MTKEREALEFIASQNFDGADDRAIAIMATMLVHKAKEALAESEQEPLEYWNAVEGWVKIDEVRQHFETVSCGTIYKTAGEGRVPLYAAPPEREWVGLTPADYDAMRPRVPYIVNDFSFCDVAAIIEAKLKEKNT